MKGLNSKKLKIEMIHDIVCSWCPIGYNNIMSAIKKSNIDVEFHFLPYELNPFMGEQGESIVSYFSRQMNWNERKLHDYQQSLVTTASKAGVIIDFSKRTHYYSTRSAHLLMHWAAQFNKQLALNECLINAYFKNGQDISNLTILLNIAEELGFDRQKTKTALTSKQLNQELDEKVSRVKVLNLSSIPAFIINETTLISGSNSVGYFEGILSEFSNESLSA